MKLRPEPQRHSPPRTFRRRSRMQAMAERGHSVLLPLDLSSPTQGIPNLLEFPLRR